LNLPISVVMVLASVFLLWFGADWLVKGASKLALSMSIKPIVIGLTVVAFGTSAPELVVSVSAAVSGTPEIALANVIGSNLANIALVLGICALINPIEIHKDTLKNDIPFLVLVSFLTYALGRYGLASAASGELGFSRLDGIIMLAFLAYFLIRIFAKSKDTTEVDPELQEILAEKETPKWQNILLVVIGALFLVAGGHLLVSGGKFIATSMGIPPYFIGLTMVALGTSLPELAASGMAAYRKETDLCMGNIIGSNVMNLILVLAVTVVIAPIAVSAEIISVQLPSMVGIVIVLYFLCRVGKLRLSKIEGVLLLLIYFGFIGFSYVSQMAAPDKAPVAIEQEG
jgi:cation:H+ antiporter